LLPPQSNRGTRGSRRPSGVGIERRGPSGQRTDPFRASTSSSSRENDEMTEPKGAATTSRREFLTTTTAAAAGTAALLGAVTPVHAAGSDTIKIGLIGC